MTLSYLKTYKRVYKLLPKSLRWKFGLIQALILLTALVDLAGLAIFIPILSAISDEEYLTNQPWLNSVKQFVGIDGSNEFLLITFLTALIFFFLRSSFILFSSWIQSRFVHSLALTIGSKTYQYYLYQNFEMFQKIESSKMVRELAVSPLHFAKFMVMPLFLVTSELVVMIFIVMAIALYNIEVFALVLLTVFPLAYLINLLLKRKIRRYGEIQNEYTLQLLGNSMRGVNGYVDVKLRAKEEVLITEYRKTLAVLNNISVKLSVISITPAKLFEVTTVLGLFVIFIYSIYFSDNPSTILSLIAIYAASTYRMIPSFSKIIPALLGLEHYNYLFGVYEKPLSLSPALGENADGNISFDSEIHLKDITFNFQGNDQHLFHGLNLIVAKGEVLGLIGKSGSGKTSLVNLIAGFLEPDHGEILIDGVPLSSQNKRSWMSHISYVQQSPFLEKGSLQRNIAFLDTEIDEDRVQESIFKASLSDLLLGQDPGSFSISEGGKNLSGGQKQRVVIARALYHKAKLIILDEATAALDNETEEEINETVRRLKGSGYTILIIAHRLSTLRYTDRIIRLEEGKIIEETTYAAIK